MHCGAVVLVELPSGRRVWVPSGPLPAPTHGVCAPCIRRHYPEFLPMLRAQFPAVDHGLMLDGA
jgi:hypothetical protein